MTNVMNACWGTMALALGGALVPSCQGPAPVEGRVESLVDVRLLRDLAGAEAWIGDLDPNVPHSDDARIFVGELETVTDELEERRGLLRVSRSALLDWIDPGSTGLVEVTSASLTVEGEVPCGGGVVSLPGTVELRAAPAEWTQPERATWTCPQDVALEDPGPNCSGMEWNGASGGALISTTTECSSLKTITLDVTADVRRILSSPSEPNFGWVLSVPDRSFGFGFFRIADGGTFGPRLRVTTIEDTYEPPDDLPAPPLDRSTVTSTWEAYRYLIESETPLQWPVATGTIDAQRAALLRGYVRDHQPLTPGGAEAPVLSGVDVTVLGHPEFGRARTNSAGLYRLLVNGGGPLVIELRRAGYLLAQRRIDAPYDGHVLLDDVAMVRAPDPSSCEAIDAVNRVAEVSDETDARGHRALRVYVPPGVELGGTLSDFHLCARERTVEPRTDGGEPVLDGEAAMVAELPRSSNYTFAAAVVARISPTGSDIEPATFSNAGVTLWLDNFVGIPEGETVPYGTYDPAVARWVPGPNGRVHTVTRSLAGTCSAAPAAPDAAELAAMCGRLGLAAGESGSFWRVPSVTHFSEIDLNFLLAVIEGIGALVRPAVAFLHRFCGVGSTVFCESQALGEMLPLQAAPFGLTYSSLRQRGREDAYRATVQVFGPDVVIPPPAFLREVIVEVRVAGQRIVATRSPPFVPGQEVIVPWDGRDAELRPVQGPQRAEVRVGYRFNTRYVAPAPGDGTFGRSGSGDEVSDDFRGVVGWTSFVTSLGVVDDRLAGIGGWNLDVHHVYDPNNGTVWLGDGARFGVEESGFIIGDAGEARPSRNQITSVAALPDGSIVYGSASEGIFLLSSDETTETLLCSVPADTNELEVADIVVGPSVGTERPDVYFLNANTSIVRRIGTADPVGGPCSGVTAVVGQAKNTILDDEVPADDGLTGLVRADPGTIELGDVEGISAALDGSLYIAERTRERVLRWSPDGTPDGLLELVAGRVLSGAACPTGTRSALCQLGATGPVAAAPDGGVFFVRRIDDVTEEIVRLDVTGRFVDPYAGGGADVRDADRRAVLLNGINALAVHPDGRLFIAHGALPSFATERVRVVGTDGVVRTVAGLRRVCAGEAGCRNHDSGSSGTPATATGITIAADVSVNGGRSFWVADGLGGRVRPARVDPLLSDTRDDDHVVSSPDGSRLWVFDRNGRHLRTLDALTGVVVHSFEYLADGRIAAVTDVEDRRFSVAWPADEASGEVLLSGPGLDATLALDAAGYASELSYQRRGFTDRTVLVHGPTGLLSTMTDPDGDLHEFGYVGGLLVSDAVPGYDQTLETVCPGRGPECRLGETRVERRLGSGAYEVVTTHSSATDGGSRLAETDLPNGLHAVLDIPLDGNASTLSVCGDGHFAPGGSRVPCRASCTPDEAAAGDCVLPHATATSAFVDDPRPERANTRYVGSSRLEWQEGPALGAVVFNTSATFEEIASADDTAVDRYTALDTVGSSGPVVRTEEHLVDGSLRHIDVLAGEAEPSVAERAEYHPERRWTRVLSDPQGRPVRIEEPGRHPVCLSWDGFHVREVRQGPTCATLSGRNTRWTWDAVTRHLTRLEVRTSSSSSSSTLRTDYAHDELGMVIGVGLPGTATGSSMAREVFTTFDSDGFLSAIITPARTRHEFTGDALNMVLSYTPPAADFSRAPVFTNTYRDSSLASESRLRLPSGLGTEGITYIYEDAPSGIDGVGTDLTRIVGPRLTFAGAADRGGDIVTHWSGEIEHVTDGRTRVDRSFRGPFLVGETWQLADGTTTSVSRPFDDRLLLDGETVTIGARSYAIDHVVRDDGSLERSSLGSLEAAYSYQHVVDLDLLDATPVDPGTRLCGAVGVTSSSVVLDGFGELRSRSVSLAGSCDAPDLTTAPYEMRVTGRDDAGRIIDRSEVRRDLTQPPPRSCMLTSEHFDYDSTGRLSGRRVRTSRCGGTGPVTDELSTYAYDANGNRAGAANAQDQPTGGGRRYDARGRLLRRGSPIENFTHDEYDRLTNWSRPGRSVDYDYDPMGRLVRISSGGATSERFFYRDEWLPVAWQRRSGSTVETWVFGYGSDGHVPDLAWVDLTSDGSIDQQVRYVHDERGSVVMLLDAATGAVLANWSYDPWGVRTGGGRAQPFGFAGGVWLEGPSFWHLGARNLDPTIGRFTSADPIGFHGGLNHYEYAGSDPINLIDPTGLTPVGSFLVSTPICAAILAMYGGDIAVAAQNILANSLGEALFGAAFARGARGGNFERMPRSPLGSQCFGEGTPVETEDGLMPIENVAEGDRVWSRDPTTGEEGYYEVVQTFVRSAPVMELEIIGDGASDVLIVTGEHPFWRRDVEGGGWVRAQDLSPGDEVFTSRGGWARVGAGTWLAREQLVYNFEVEGSHTYFVGETGLWVHNACSPNFKPPTNPPSLPRHIPPHYVTRPADSGRGVVYHAPGTTGNANTVRVMEPTPDYPDGYWVEYNAHGQPINPSTGRPGARPDTHVPLPSVLF